MTIDKAIEILSSNGLRPVGTTWGQYEEAQKLGLEALNVIKNTRSEAPAWRVPLLPGETEE